MQTEKQEWVKIGINGAQALLVLAIAMTSGYWAWYTRATDQRQAAEREETEQRQAAEQRLAEQRQVAEQRLAEQRQAAEQRVTEQRTAQAEAISQMSSQLGLMQAQCNASDRQLRELGNQETLTLRKRQCYEAYIGARSLYFLSSVRIRRDPDTSLSDWNAAWEGLEQSLIQAGSVRYSEEEMSKSWQAIVGMADRFERREP